jgi:hypothetical protein
MVVLRVVVLRNLAGVCLRFGVTLAPSWEYETAWCHSRKSWAEWKTEILHEDERAPLQCCTHCRFLHLFTAGVYLPMPRSELRYREVCNCLPRAAFTYRSTEAFQTKLVHRNPRWNPNLLGVRWKENGSRRVVEMGKSGWSERHLILWENIKTIILLDGICSVRISAGTPDILTEVTFCGFARSLETRPYPAISFPIHLLT